MTNQQHPITPPLELLDKWNNMSLSNKEILVIVAQWGADQELEACCEWVAVESITAATELRAWRRPKPPSLKEQALGILDVAHHDVLEDDQIATIRRALEQLDD
jgi:hypothetical protein